MQTRQAHKHESDFYLKIVDPLWCSNACDAHNFFPLKFGGAFLLHHFTRSVLLIDFVFIEVIRCTLTRRIIVPVFNFSFDMRTFWHSRWGKKSVYMLMIVGNIVIYLVRNWSNTIIWSISFFICDNDHSVRIFKRLSKTHWEMWHSRYWPTVTRPSIYSKPSSLRLMILSKITIKSFQSEKVL